jgi:hypothetical protein
MGGLSKVRCGKVGRVWDDILEKETQNDGKTPGWKHLMMKNLMRKTWKGK